MLTFSLLAEELVTLASEYLASEEVEVDKKGISMFITITMFYIIFFLSNVSKKFSILFNILILEEKVI